MEPEFTTDELKAELARAQKLVAVCETAGEVDAANVYSSLVRGLQNALGPRA